MDRSVGYLVHNLNDPALERRVSTLLSAGLNVQLAGFYRTEPVTEIAGQPAAALQRSHSGRLSHRAGLVLANLIDARRLQEALESCAILLARNLEMLVLAAWLRKPGQRLVYECLDIHRLLLRRDALGTGLRRLEKRLINQCDGVITSSPAYLERYFRSLQNYRGPVEVAENKLSAKVDPGPSLHRAAIAPLPWKIGWFGMLRCSRSLALFQRLVQAFPGLVEVHLAGVPAYNEMPDFDAVVANTPGLRFTGRYAPKDLPKLYGKVHFAWCVDYFEDGLNSDWLLPNRLYESIACGCVPLAAQSVETGSWLTRNKVGLCFDSPENGLFELIGSLTENFYAQLKRGVLALPLERVTETRQDARLLANCLVGSAT